MLTPCVLLCIVALHPLRRPQPATAPTQPRASACWCGLLLSWPAGEIYFRPAPRKTAPATHATASPPGNTTYIPGSPISPRVAAIRLDGQGRITIIYDSGLLCVRCSKSASGQLPAPGHQLPAHAPRRAPSRHRHRPTSNFDVRRPALLLTFFPGVVAAVARFPPEQRRGSIACKQGTAKLGLSRPRRAPRAAARGALPVHRSRRWARGKGLCDGICVVRVICGERAGRVCDV